MIDGEKICGCTLVASRAAISPPAEVPQQIGQALTPGVSVNLPGGTFLMGTDYAGGFPMDGEGPVGRVSLSPFAVDVFPVTNAEYATFLRATSYRTEAEVFGWSFVFWAHIPPQRFDELVEDTVAAAPWWCKGPGATWDHPEGPGSNVQDRLQHPVVHVSWNDASAYIQWICLSGLFRGFGHF